jgi:hypothetical protein
MELSSEDFTSRKKIISQINNNNLKNPTENLVSQNRSLWNARQHFKGSTAAPQ